MTTQIVENENMEPKHNLEEQEVEGHLMSSIQCSACTKTESEWLLNKFCCHLKLEVVVVVHAKKPISKKAFGWVELH